MVLLSVGAVAVGLVVILLASGVLGGKDGGSTGDLLVPIRPTPPELVDPTNSRALGPADAPVTIEVWSDFQCPACGFFAQVDRARPHRGVRPHRHVRLVYRDIAFIDGGDPNGESHQSAAAARCAGDQGKFWQYHDYLFENQDGENKGAFRRESLDQIATAVGLDMAAYGSCMDERRARAGGHGGDGPGAGRGRRLHADAGDQRRAPEGRRAADGGQSSGPGLRTLIDAELAKVSPAPGASASPAP